MPHTFTFPKNCTSLFHSSCPVATLAAVGATIDVHFYVPLMCVDPIDGIKGKTWGPSTIHKDRYRSTSSILANDRCCKSAPNIQKTLCRLGGHSNIGALQELGKFPLKYVGMFTLLLLIY